MAIEQAPAEAQRLAIEQAPAEAQNPQNPAEILRPVEAQNPVEAQRPAEDQKQSVPQKKPKFAQMQIKWVDNGKAVVKEHAKQNYQEKLRINAKKMTEERINYLLDKIEKVSCNDQTVTADIES